MEIPLITMLITLSPGKIEETSELINIYHNSGDTSTLWLKKTGTLLPEGLAELDYIYNKIDGADLFSSAFKIASLKEAKFLGEVKITSTISELNQLCKNEHVNFESDAIPFMTENGVWIYGFCSDTGKIAKWDLENTEFCEYYNHLNEILKEWTEVSDK